jgi:Ca2+-transporting ATPase
MAEPVGVAAASSIRMSQASNAAPDPEPSPKDPSSRPVPGPTADRDEATKPGLSSTEAARRLARDGPNALPPARSRGLWTTAREILTEPMFLLLIAAGTLYLVLGEARDAALLMAAVVLIILITVVQERRTERALDALREMASPRARVVRDGVIQRIAASALVTGDRVLLVEGDRIPADALLREAIALRVDESLLTGESLSVDKRPDSNATRLSAPISADSDSGPPSASASLYAGTLVVAGQGVCEVVHTGVRTEFGRIGLALTHIEAEPTPLTRQTARMVRWMAIFGILACMVLAIGYALTRGADLIAWRDGGLAGIALAMSLLPEELPVVLTVFFAIGAWRLSRHHVLTRRLPAIEALGAASVLCVDKTGTLTLNRMSVAQTLAFPGSGFNAEELLETAALACPQPSSDPMDRAIRTAREHRTLSNDQDELVAAYPITTERLAFAQIWRTRTMGCTGSGGTALRVAVKGAPEAIADLCRLNAGERTSLDHTVRTLAAEGYRILAVARSDIPDLGSAPPALESSGLKPIGLIAFSDPLRPEVPDAIRECREAGIRVVMITGDYPDTAVTIARAAGLPESSLMMSGAELDRLSDERLIQRIGDVGVFARVAPAQKLRIVRALQARGEVVAMTGDGVNDAPALKAAHIGIAMGARGSDVAREAASIVLLDDAFPSIVEAVRQGRRIFGNLKKAATFILAVHVPIAGLAMLPVFNPAWPLLLLPIHIAVLELVIDPTCSLVFENEPAEADVMRQPPRSPNAPLFSVGSVALALLEGLSLLAACLIVYTLSSPGHPAEVVIDLRHACDRCTHPDCSQSEYARDAGAPARAGQSGVLDRTDLDLGDPGRRADRAVGQRTLPVCTSARLRFDLRSLHRGDEPGLGRSLEAHHRVAAPRPPLSECRASHGQDPSGL